MVPEVCEGQFHFDSLPRRPPELDERKSTSTIPILQATKRWISLPLQFFLTHHVLNDRDDPFMTFRFHTRHFGGRAARFLMSYF